MTCPKCGGKTRVYYSRASVDTVTRYRKCKVCGYCFKTTEIEFDVLESMTTRRKTK